MNAFTYHWSADDLNAETRGEVVREIGGLDDATILSRSIEKWVTYLYEQRHLRPIEKDASRATHYEPGPEKQDIVRVIYPIVPHASNEKTVQLRGSLTKDSNGSYSNILNLSHLDERSSALLLHTSQEPGAVTVIVEQAEEMIRYVNSVANSYNMTLSQWLVPIVKKKWDEAAARQTRLKRFEAEMRELDIVRLTNAPQPLEIRETQPVALLQEYVAEQPREIEYRMPPAIVSAIIDLIEHASYTFELAPQAYLKLGEELLRMVIVGYINAGFRRNVATGETFVGDGKADIQINPREGQVLVVEVKQWKGEQLYVETIHQLFRYVPWHSSVGVVLTYTTNANLKSVIATARAATQADGTMRGAVRVENERHFVSVNVHPRDVDKRMEVHHFLFTLHSPTPNKRGPRSKSERASTEL